MTEPVIVIHGGAWAIPDKLASSSIEGVKQAAREGYNVLRRGGTAVDAVQAAVTVLENNPAFDAGYGAVLNSKGEVELDAMIMDGCTLNSGAVAAVQNIANPVQLARLVMDQTDHCLLVGQGANDFAAEMSIATVAPDALVTQEAKNEFERYMEFQKSVKSNFSPRENTEDMALSGHDTVGAVALDKNGNVACATSTGGITAKRPGRVGDSPLIGSGGYADNESGAVSCTGHGESILKICLAHSITNGIQQGSTAQQAAQTGLALMSRRCHGSGGAVVVSKNGDIGKAFSTERMAWATVKHDLLQYGLNPKEQFEERLNNY